MFFQIFILQYSCRLARILPDILLLASAVEIFLQNFLTGVVTAVLHKEEVEKKAAFR